MTTEKTPYDKKSLRELFSMVSLHEASVENNDLLVIWPLNQDPVQIVPLTEENKTLAIEQNSMGLGLSSKEMKVKARYAALRGNGQMDPQHLVVLASIPSYAKHFSTVADMDGSWGVRASTKTQNMLSAAIPCPTPEQMNEIEAFKSLMSSYGDLIEAKKKILDTQEKLRQAILLQIMEGRVDKDQAKQYIKEAMGPEYRAYQNKENTPQKSKKPKLRSP